MTGPTSLEGPASAVDLSYRVEQLYDGVVAIRRDLHRHPEVGLALPRTRDLVARRLADLGLAVTSSDTISSVTALIRGRFPGAAALLGVDAGVGTAPA